MYNHVICLITQDEVQWWTVENNLGQQGLAPVPYIKPVKPAQVKKSHHHHHHKKEHNHHHRQQNQRRHSKHQSLEADPTAKSMLATSKKKSKEHGIGHSQELQGSFSSPHSTCI